MEDSKRQGGAEVDESSVRAEITDAMILAGVTAFVEWTDQKKTDPGLSRADLAVRIYVAMRRVGQKH